MKVSNYLGLALVLVVLAGVKIVICTNVGLNPFIVFLDPPSFLIVLFPTIGGAIFAFGWGNFRKALRIGFGKAESSNKEDCLLGMRLFHTMKTISVASGIVGTLIGVIIMLGGLADGSGIDVEKVGAGLAVAVLTILYALILSYYFLLPLARNCESKAADKG